MKVKEIFSSHNCTQGFLGLRGEIIYLYGLTPTPGNIASRQVTMWLRWKQDLMINMQILPTLPKEVWDIIWGCL